MLGNAPLVPAWQKLCPVSPGRLFCMRGTGETLSVKRLVCRMSSMELKVSVAGITQHEADLIVTDFNHVGTGHG